MIAKEAALQLIWWGRAIALEAKGDASFPRTCEKHIFAVIATLTSKDCLLCQYSAA